MSSQEAISISTFSSVSSYHDQIERILISRDEIATRVRHLGKQITEDFQRWQPETDDDANIPAFCPSIEIITLLTGSLLFTADLIRELPLPLHIHPIKVSSYEGKTRSKETKWEEAVGRLPTFSPHHYILIVDDILDSGETLLSVISKIKACHPQTAAQLHLKSCVLLDKKLSPTPPGRIKMPASDFTGFEIPDEFVVGYGLDYDGKYRNLPDIAIMKP